MAKQRTIKVFIASPGDLTPERRAFKDTVDSLNKTYGRGAGVEFKPLGWEDTLSQAGRRPQDEINKDVNTCEIFILVMWRKWGQKALDARPHRSYTEEEYKLALTRYEKTKSPCIHVFFKDIDSGQIADPGPQLKKVLKFRRELEASNKVLYRRFKDEKDFAVEIQNHLMNDAEGDGQTSPLPTTPVVPVPSDVVNELKPDLKRARTRQRRAEVKVRNLRARHGNKADKRKLAASRADLAEAKSAVHALGLAESAAKAALDGRIEEARQNFAKALDGTTNLRILYLGYEFYARIGDLDEAEQLLHRSLSISGLDNPTEDTAAALGNLGIVAMTRGDLDAAETFYNDALAIYRKRGSFAGQANTLGNLGIIAMTRGDRDTAEKVLNDALAIDRKLGRLEGQASDLGNLGIIAHTRDDLDAAERFHTESLAIHRKLGSLEGQASNLGNLGIIAKTRAKLDTAEKLYSDALAIYRKLGSLEGQASVLGNLGNIAGIHGNLDAAETFYSDALAIERKLRRLEGQANQLANLGSLAELRESFPEARWLWTDSRDLYAKLGAKHMVEKVQGWLDGLATK